MTAAEFAISGNDVAVVVRSGLCIAINNADPEVQQAVEIVTDSDHDDGFTDAVERFILSTGRSIVQVAAAHAAGRT